MNKMNVVLFFIFVLTCLSGTRSTVAAAQQSTRPFTVADEIGLAHFGEPYTGQAEAVRASPDGQYFAVDTERGRLDLNCVEDSLRFYRSADIEHFLQHSDELQQLSPVWVVNRSGAEGPIIKAWRWFADSSGVAFLERTTDGNQRLVLADLRTETIEPLVPSAETIEAFDVRNRNHYVYTAADLVAEREKRQVERQSPAIAGTELRLNQLLFPEDPTVVRYHSDRRYYLYAVVGGKRFKVLNDGAPLVPGDLALSPDGRYLVTTLPVPDVPSSWETLYPPPYGSSPRRIHSGHQDVPWGSVHEYVRIDLQGGSVQALTGAPTASDGGWWWGGRGPSWSSDGHAILLPGTFIKSKDNAPSRPCVAVVDLPSNTSTCVEMLKSHTETGVGQDYYSVESARFVGGEKQCVTVIIRNRLDWSFGTTEYRRITDGTWQVAGQSKDVVTQIGHDGLEVTVNQGLNEPPRLVATNRKASQVIWDPNPQLKNIGLGQASVYTWKDKEGRDWRSGLYKPKNYKAGQRYPLVIQTHGFDESHFEPSGIFPTAFAARELAAAGIVVLQIDEHCPTVTPNEAPCAVSAYEAASSQLVSEGLVDPEKIGIIGFSRTCFYVIETLETGSLRLRAASITDGTMKTYLEYMMWEPGSAVAREANAMIGAAPFGEGLQQWLKRSPGFNLDKVSAPVLVIGGGPPGVLNMWEPYAGFRYLQKPADFMMLHTDEHILTNPAVRMASQGGTVDWFRFWLKDEEDPDPAKAEQYARWRELRKMQEENDKKANEQNQHPAPQPQGVN